MKSTFIDALQFVEMNGYPRLETKQETDNTDANNSMLRTELECFEACHAQEHERRNNMGESHDENARQDRTKTNIAEWCYFRLR